MRTKLLALAVASLSNLAFGAIPRSFIRSPATKSPPRRTRTLKPDHGNQIPNHVKKGMGLPHQGAKESARRLRQIAAGNRQDLSRH